MYEMLLAWALLTISGRRIKMASESLESEQDGKHLGANAQPYKALVPLLIAFSPIPSDALVAPGVPPKAGSRSAVSSELVHASEKIRARWPEHWPEKQSHWYQEPWATSLSSNRSAIFSELFHASEKIRARWPEHWPEKESRWYQKQEPAAGAAPQPKMTPLDDLHAWGKTRARWPEYWPEDQKEPYWYQQKVPAARAGPQPTMMALGKDDTPSAPATAPSKTTPARSSVVPPDTMD